MGHGPWHMSGMLIRGHSVAWLMWLMWQGRASRVEEITVSWRCPLGLLIFIWLCRRFFFFVVLSSTFILSFLRPFYCFVFTAVAVMLLLLLLFWVIQFSATVFGQISNDSRIYTCIRYTIEYACVCVLTARGCQWIPLVLLPFHAQFVWILFLFCRIVNIRCPTVLARLAQPEKEKGQRTFNITARWVNLLTTKPRVA